MLNVNKSPQFKIFLLGLTISRVSLYFTYLVVIKAVPKMSSAKTSLRNIRPISYNRCSASAGVWTPDRLHFFSSSVLQSRIQQWAWAPYCWSVTALLTI